MHNAACRGMGHLFFPPQDDEENLKVETGRDTRIALARSICADCDVYAECDEWAERTNFKHGICAGMTYVERRAIRSA